MKTLYININGENTQSFDDVIVIGKPENALINKFHFELGNEIKKGVFAPDVRQAALINGFMSQYKTIYEEKILPQLDAAKYLMLSQDHRGKYSIQLPQEYIEWLNYNGESVYSEIAKSLKEKGGVVEINLERIYRNGISLLINSIESGDYGQLVVNDNAVEDDTEMIVAIRQHVNNMNLPFVHYTEWYTSGKEEQSNKNQSSYANNESDSKVVDDRVLLVTYKEPKVNKDWYEYREVYDVEVFREQSTCNSIFRGIFEMYSSKIKLDDGHIILTLNYKMGNDEDGWDERYSEVSVNGIRKGLKYEETTVFKKECFDSNIDVNHRYDYDNYVEQIKEKYHKYEEVDYVGFSIEKGMHILLGAYHENVLSQEINGADVITDQGDLLFKTKNDIIPDGVFPSGLILAGKINKAFNTILYGVMDMNGNLLIPCLYCEQSLDDGMRFYNKPKEIEPGIIKFDYQLYINVYTGEQYVEVTNNYYVKAYDEYLVDCDIIYKKTGKVVTSHININNIETWHETYLGGWNGVLMRDQYINLLLHKEDVIELLEYEEVMCDFNNNIPCISENRIVSYRLEDGANTLIPPYFSFINIRDYQGNIIRAIENPDFLVIKPYKFGKALALRMEDEEPQSLIYLDLEGQEHTIPFDIDGVEYQYIYNSFFASDNTIVVKNDGEDMLIDLQGKVLLNEEGHIERISDKYLKFYSYKKHLWGLIDNQGEIIFSPRYLGFDILE